MSVRTVKISNVSYSATEQDIKEFFSFSGEIDHVELKSFDEWSRVAYVTFRDSQGAETAILLSGTTIVDQSVIITPASDYQPPLTILAPPSYQENQPINRQQSAARKAEDVFATMLAKGYVLGKGTVGKVKEVDQRFQVSGKTKSAISAAEQKVSNAGSAMLKNKYIFKGVSFVSGAFNKVSQAANDLGSMTKQKVMAEQMKKGTS